MKLFLIEIQK